MRSLLETPELRRAVEAAADPDRVRASLERLGEAHPELTERLRDDSLLRDALVAVADASGVLTRAVIADTSVAGAVLDDPDLTAEWERDRYHESWRCDAGRVDPEVDGAAEAHLRRWKRRHLFRIAVRDLLGLADLPSVGRELAALADACLGAALEISAPATPLAVVGMGKLGGQELNYSSDVDVLFVHGTDHGAQAEAERAAKRLLAVMARPTADGIVFRTDADLRPEGRAGPLSRSLDAYEAYYERWAGAWEFQALIKARPVTGDEAIGSRFFEMTRPVVWPEVLDPDAIREIRALKARGEAQLRRQGLSERELKRGRGGIRDVEFAVQILQLVHGRHDPEIRSPNTLVALDQLAGLGYVALDDARQLGAAYRFLRTVEHRLQLREEQQVHALPPDEASRTHLARVLGYRDRGGRSALEQFEETHRHHQAVVRSIHERLFFGPLLEALAGAGPLSGQALQERLAAFGFRDAQRTRAALDELTRGLTRQSRLMQQLFPLLLEWLSTSPDPDLGLLQLRTLAEGPARSTAVATAIRESPGSAERLCTLLGSSRVIGRALRRQPDFVGVLADDTFLQRERGHEEMVSAALQTLAWRRGDEGRLEGIRRFKRRELLRVAARDLLGFAPIEAVGRELSGLADATIEAVLHSLAPSVPFAVVGLGRLGGTSLSYASDVDVLFVYEGEGAAAFGVAEPVAEAVVRGVGATTAEGEAFAIDARLRPEGKQGPLARSLDGYRTYYERWAQTWELQALSMARVVAGDERVGRAFLEIIEPLVYPGRLPGEAVREIRRMKARIERERIPPGEDPQFHLKLGRGSLSDVEFAVQLLKLQHGSAHEEVRDPSILGAMSALVRAGVLAHEDAEALAESYRFCERVRNHRFLLTGDAADSLPTNPQDGLHLARMLGYTHRPQAALRDDYRRVTRRARSVFERVFYGRD